MFQICLLLADTTLGAPQGQYNAPPAAPAGYGAPPEPKCETKRVPQPTSYNCKQDQECSTSYEEQCEVEYQEKCETKYEVSIVVLQTRLSQMILLTLILSITLSPTPPPPPK